MFFHALLKNIVHNARHLLFCFSRYLILAEFGIDFRKLPFDQAAGISGRMRFDKGRYFVQIFRIDKLQNSVISYFFRL